MRDYKNEIEKRVAFIRKALSESSADGVIYANSGGKDCTLAGILCKIACDNTVGIILPCGSRRNFNEDRIDAEEAAKQFGIETRLFDLTDIKSSFMALLGEKSALSDLALANIAPRLRMIALYTVGMSENRLVVGTGNRSEVYMGYFTKWGDGAYDFNPIADLTVTEIYEFLRYLNVPATIIEKAPSAGLYEGQTDEDEMGITYEKIDRFLLYGEASEGDRAIIDKYHARSGHKRKMPAVYGE